MSIDFKAPMKNTKALLMRFFATPLEIRAIKEGKKMNKVFSTFRDDWNTNWAETRNAVVEQNNENNIFISLNPLKKEYFGETKYKNGSLKVVTNATKDSDIARYRWLLIDFDPVRKNVPSQSVSSTDEEKRYAEMKLQEVCKYFLDMGFYHPVVCDSGNGYHAHFRIDLENTEENKALIKRLLNIVSKKFSDENVKIDTTVFNPARIIKMYGTRARKGVDDEKNGRPHRRSAFLFFPDGLEKSINTKETLEKIAGHIDIKDREEIVASEEAQRKRIEWVRAFLEEHEICFWEEDDHGEVKFFFEEGCPFDPSHKRKDAYICVFKNGKVIFKCLHESCSDNHWAEFVKLFDPEYKTYEERLSEADESIESLLGEQATDEETSKEEKKPPKKVKLDRDEKNRVLQHISNYMKVLRNDPKVCNLFGYNEYTQLPENMKTGVDWTDTDDIKIFEYLETKYGLTKWDQTIRAINLRINENKFNPITEKLNSLKWDGTPRIKTCFTDFLGADDSEYTQEVAKMLFLGAVWRAYDPGCKFDNMVVLVGPQGCGKSTFAKRLSLDDRYFTDAVRGIGEKEAAEQLMGSWIVEWGEMSAMKRAKDAESIKLFIAQQSDKFRPPYGRRVATYPRRCIFIGTTNDDAFLSDRTGNRRFFPVKVEKGKKSIWGEDAAEYFEQMMAEAVVMYKNGEKPRLPKHLSEVVLEAQNACVEEDSREGVINLWLEQHPDVDNICVRMVWLDILEMDKDKPLSWFDSRAIGSILSNSPFLKKGTSYVFPEYGKQRVWKRV